MNSRHFYGVPLYFEPSDDTFFRELAKKNKAYRDEQTRRQVARLNKWKNRICAAIVIRKR